jgi:hypothetical protein
VYSCALVAAAAAAAVHSDMRCTSSDDDICSHAWLY